VPEAPAGPALTEDSRVASPEVVAETPDAESVLIYERLLPAEGGAGAVSRIRRELDAVLADHDVAAALRTDIGLSLSEAATNVVLHAYPDARSGPLYVAAALKGTSLILSVIDSGSGTTARPGRPGAGLGLDFLQRLSDELAISSDASGPGTAVHATFESAILDASSPPAPCEEERDLPGVTTTIASLRRRRPD
jgi:anti-sigma regulatory factor (Ser/Thr protein kinase)